MHIQKNIKPINPNDCKINVGILCDTLLLESVNTQNRHNVSIIAE